MIPFPKGPFSVVYADPAWTFVTRSEKGKGRSPEQHYECMTLSDIRALPVPEIAAEDSVLFLWSTYPHLPMAMEVMAGWGFRYSTVAFTFVKTTKTGKWHVGLGYTTRANPEVVLLGIRGKGLKRVDKSVRNLVVAPVGRHSEKPAEVRRRIEKLYGDVPRVELFARGKAPPGWTFWGNEVG